jgi:hypothetical protein
VFLYPTQERSLNPNFVSGYCCLDAPYEREGNTYGNAFTCDLGIQKCKNLAPKLAGFSEGSCDVYSGTWCQHPRDCSYLKQCIADEIAWAKEHKKGAYEEYLVTAPKIEQNDSLDQCGGKVAVKVAQVTRCFVVVLMQCFRVPPLAVREYFGFDANFPGT